MILLYANMKIAFLNFGITYDFCHIQIIKYTMWSASWLAGLLKIMSPYRALRYAECGNIQIQWLE